MPVYIPDKNNSHLRDLILQWKANPDGHHPDLVVALDKIVATALRKCGRTGNARSFEEPEDLIGYYRMFCMILLNRIREDANNREMYSYISRSIYLHAKNKKKSSVQKNLLEQDGVLKMKKQLVRTKPHARPADNVVHFDDADMSSLSELLIRQYSPEEARNCLGWSKEKLITTMENLRDYYRESGYGQ